MTQPELLSLNENQLRKDVLILLFKKMGFRDVSSYHGGSLEQGKDIVMWKEDDIRGRVNYAVVIKAKKITGKASGKNSASEVRLQIEQCFSKKYTDPNTPESRNVDHCYLVCPHEINKEARYALEGPLEKINLNKLIDYIHGNKLWELIQKYLPETIISAKIEEIRRDLINISPDYAITAEIKEKAITYDIKSKRRTDEQEELLKTDIKLKFPDTTAGREMLEAINNHISTGAPVELTKPYIEEIRLPEIINRILGTKKDIKIDRIKLGTTTTSKPFIVKIEFKSDIGNRQTLDHIEFKVVQAGIDEITLSNIDQNIPCHIQIILNSKDKLLKVGYTFKYADFNVNRVLGSLQFQRVLAEGGIHIIRHLDTGLIVANPRIQAGIFQNPNRNLIKLIEKLVFIQEKTHTQIILPHRNLTIEEINNIFEIAKQLETGMLLVKGGKFSFEMDKKGATNILELIEKETRGLLKFSGDVSSGSIFGIPIQMGPVTTSIKNFYMLAEDKELLLKKLANPGKQKTFPIRLKTDENVEMIYHNWRPIKK